MPPYTLILYFSLFGLFLCISGGAGVLQRQQVILRENLLKNYDRYVRPVHDVSQPTVVTLSMTPHQIIDLMETEQVLRLNVWIKMSWTDEFLSWNTTEYTDVLKLKFSSEEVWKPDVFLYNGADNEHPAAELFVNPEVTVYPSGRVSWSMPVHLVTACKMNMGNYPFDIQRCAITFGPWTATADEILMQNCTEPSLTHMISHNEWVVVEVPCKASVLSYSTGGYSDVTYTIVMGRKSSFYMLNVVLPCMLLLSISWLVFFTPPASGEKVSLSITVALAMLVFLLVIMDYIPATSDEIPVITVFVLVVTTLFASSTIISVVILNLHYKGDYGTKPPSWLRRLAFNGLRHLTIFNRRIIFKRKTVIQYKGSVVSNQVAISDATNAAYADDNEDGHEVVEEGAAKKGVLEKNGGIPLKIKDSKELNGSSLTKNQINGDLKLDGKTLDTNSVSDVTLIKTLREILVTLQLQRILLHRKHEAESEDASSQEEWKLIALVFDSFFALVYLFLTVALMVYIIVQYLLLSNH